VPRYDLLVAADVFVYLGDLTPVFRAAAAAAADGALFAFSTELLQQAGAPDEQQQQPYALQATGRCSHAPAHLRDVAAQCGWRVLLLEEAELRKNAGQPILGCLCVMQLRSLRN
jgi:predicted TPR repeat methyltransferase